MSSALASPARPPLRRSRRSRLSRLSGAARVIPLLAGRRDTRAASALAYAAVATLAFALLGPAPAAEAAPRPHAAGAEAAAAAASGSSQTATGTTAATSALPPALAASFRAGTVEADIRSGRITVDELVAAAEANLGEAAHASAHDRAAEHAEIVRETEAQVAQMRLGRPSSAEDAPTRIDVDASGHLVATVPGQSSDPLAAPGISTTATATADQLITPQKSWWKKLWHFIDYPSFHFYLTSQAVKVIVSAGGALAAGLICAATGPIGCAFAGGMVSGVATFVLVNHCGDAGIHVTYPDLQKSHCG